MSPSRPLPNPSPNKRGSGVSVSYVDYKFYTADLSQVCDCRTLRPKMKYNATKERDAPRISEACQEVAIDHPRDDDVDLGSLQDYLRRRASRIEKMRRRLEDQASRSRGDASVGAGRADRGVSRSSRGSRSGGDASAFARAVDPATTSRRLPSPDAAASSPSGRDVPPRRSSSCERAASASGPRGASSSSPPPTTTASAPPYRRTSSLPADGPVDRPRTVLRRKFRPRHHCMNLNKSVEGIMKAYSRYSSGSGVVDVDAVVGDDGSAAPGVVVPTKTSCRKNPPPGKEYVRKHSKDSLCSVDTTLASSGQSLWSDGDGWVPAGVEFSSSIEVYLYDRE